MIQLDVRSQTLLSSRHSLQTSHFNIDQNFKWFISIYVSKIKFGFQIIIIIIIAIKSYNFQF